MQRVQAPAGEVHDVLAVAGHETVAPQAHAAHRPIAEHAAGWQAGQGQDELLGAVHIGQAGDQGLQGNGQVFQAVVQADAIGLTCVAEQAQRRRVGLRSDADGDRRRRAAQLAVPGDEAELRIVLALVAGASVGIAGAA